MDRVEMNLLRAAGGLVLVGVLATIASLDSLDRLRPAEPRVTLAASTAGPVRFCQLRVGDRLLQVPLGSGVNVEGKWRSCELYDGHPVVVHSAERPHAPL